MLAIPEFIGIANDEYVPRLVFLCLLSGLQLFFRIVKNDIKIMVLAKIFICNA